MSAAETDDGDRISLDLWLEGLTLGEALRETARRFPDNEALVIPQHDFRATYAEYDALVDEAARGLLALGIEQGDHVAIWSINRPEWVLLQMAAARVGAVLVTVNPAFQEKELRYVLEQSDSKALFLTDRFKSSDYFGRAQAVLPEMADYEPGSLEAEAAPRLRWVISLPDEHPDGMMSWADMIERGRDEAWREALVRREVALDPHEPINLQYTSGTTGFPKGATLSHRNLLLNAWYVGECQKLDETDRVCSPVPLYHCFGCVIGVLACMVHGSTLLIPSEYFDALATLDCIEQERATALYGVPTMFIAVLEQPTFAGRDLSSLRTGVMAGAPCPVELMKKVMGDLGAEEVTIAYGLTECSPAATQTKTDDPIELRVTTVGAPVPGVEVSVFDPETGEVCEDGVQGEIRMRGHNVMIGYYNMAEATADAIDEKGWLHSGDLGIRDPNGYFRITGRIKDMIIRGGENIYPREIEEVLYRHPAVEEAEVVGIPDDRFGEEVVACVKAQRGTTLSVDELRQHCKDHLAYFKVPRHILLVESFPTTVTGKVQKFKLRDIAVQMLQEQAEVVA
jgi:fatty-acyl-CoA synthase